MISGVDITVKEGGVRLDAALLAAFPTTARSLVREGISAGDVLVDGHCAAKGMKLHGGERISVLRLAETKDNTVAPNPAIAVKEMYADDSLLAFDKPCGMAVHPISRGETGTLMNAVVARYPECIPLGDHPLMAGALHRIDSGTSGLVLVARTAESFAALRAQFAAQTVRKTYLALVEGEVAVGGTLENDLAHDPTLPYCRMIDARRNRLTMAMREKLRPMRAVTKFTPVGRTTVGNETRTLLEVTIFTGVTHQIRAQLAMARMHIVGDTLYGAFPEDGMEGHCLHALAAAFSHPSTGQAMEIRTEYPQWAKI
ncbi:MAG: RluA family pseudouridine synthase [Kiritimatiellae bacterium]|nr:RluA family pseudouridine synthase [Kiritimatiellia bacterium]